MVLFQVLAWHQVLRYHCAFGAGLIGVFEMLKIAVIYMIYFFNISNKIYIGSTCDFVKRFCKHFSSLRTGTHGNKHLQSAFDKYGEENMVIVKLEEIPLEEALQPFGSEDYNYLTYLEDFYISQYRSNEREYGYNKRKVANSNVGIKRAPFTEEHRLKIGQSLKGRVFSEEHKQKIGEATSKRLKGIPTGRVTSEETKEKIRKSKIGIPRTQEVKIKISQVKLAKRKTHCKNGHEFTEENTISVIRNDRGGRIERKCKQCNLEWKAKQKENKNG